MRVELLKDIVHSVIGEKSKGIVELLSVKKNVNEFIIAKKLGLTINQTRNLLYKLSDEGLVSVIRKKNKKKGGWYDHFWTLNLEKSLFKFRENVSKRIDSIRQQVEVKKKERFYYCGNCGIELSEEQALIQEYTCIECGQILILKDNSKDVISLEKEAVVLEREFIEANAELVIISQKEAKLRAKRQYVEGVKKAKEKADRRKAAKKERNKNLNQNLKKNSKKKKFKSLKRK